MEKNKLPDGWIITTLENIGKITTGNTPSKKKLENYGDYLPWVKPPQLEQDSPIVYTPEKLSKLGSKSARILEKDSVLVSCIGDLGKVGYAGTPLATNQQINSVTFYDIVEPKFGFYFFKSHFFSNWLNENKSATVISIINKGRFLKAPFILCPLNEQKRIVEKIEEVFSLTDNILKNLKKIKKQLIQYRHSFYSNFYSNFETKPLGSCCDLIAGQHIQKQNYNTQKKGMAYLTGPADFTEKYPVVSKWTDKPKTIARKGDVLITVKGAGVGKTNILNIDEACISRQLMAVRPHTLSSDFVYSYFKSKFHEFQKMGQSTTVAGISKNLILNFLLPQVISDEQETIIDNLDFSQTKIIHILYHIENLMIVCHSLRSSILKQAFEGKLVPQDPNDEPASELLKRIKQDTKI